MSDNRVRKVVNDFIKKHIQRHGLVVGIIIICVAIFTGITAFTNFITFLPFNLAINLTITLLIIAIIVLVIWRTARSTLKTTSPIGELEMHNDAGVEEEYEYVRYKYLTGRGILKFGSLRDVALRVETLLMIFDAITENVSDYETILEQTGKRVGESFERDFQRVLDADLDLRSKSLSFSDKLNRWLKYDSKAGMGQFSGNLDQNFEGQIIVENCFLTYQRRLPRNKPLCAFMCGYIEGVLQEMSGSHYIRVSHPTQEGVCGTFDRDPERCIFTINNTRIHPDCES